MITRPASPQSSASAAASGSAPGASPPGAPSPGSHTLQTRSAMQDRSPIEKPLRSRSPLAKSARLHEALPMDTTILDDDDSTTLPAPGTPLPSLSNNLQEVNPPLPPSQGSLGSFPAAQSDPNSQHSEGSRVAGLGSSGCLGDPPPLPLPTAPALRGRRPGLPPSGAASAVDFDALVAEAMKTTVLPLLDSQKSGILVSVEATLLSNNKAVGEQCHAICTSACTKANEVVVQRLDTLDGAVTKLGEHNTKLQDKVDALTDRLGKVLSSLGHSNSLPNLPDAADVRFGTYLGTPADAPPAHSVTTPFFQRAPDPTKLFVNIHNKAMVTLVHFNTAFEKLADDCGQHPSLFEVTGDLLDNRFDIQYLGPKGTATANCLTLFQSLYLGRGKHKDTVCVDERGLSHKFYINPDRNGAQIRREILCKELKNLIMAAFPNANLFVQKNSGSVLYKRRVLATVVVIDPISARISWMPAGRIELGLVDEVLANVESHFSNLTGGVTRP